ncbi:MAG: hypothetical protein UY40_C0001G0004 [candidate division CPR1 bacterium GW2011_GWC1_49_13]|uniref:Uncharacterized protein n=1 Tax=candidate division CPR1 bacterium GW2011_GWC1_49_13 TaxID=1618342 RepID=A0A0G1VIG4_9BACT|nr:MAG: hypothetical protein UY40_C0001G0004 [candidate division CPR1 bacterium GW2011_GWC1_49_13]
MKPKIAFGFHVKELDHDSQITVDEVVQQAYSRGYQEVVLFAHTYHPTDLAPLDIKILQDVFHQDYPLPVSFAPEVNIHPEWDDGQVGGVYLDMLDFRELGIPLKSVVLSLHFTAAIFRNKKWDELPCHSQNVWEMERMYFMALNAWERRRLPYLFPVPVVVGHPYKYALGDEQNKALAFHRLCDFLGRKCPWAWLEAPLREWEFGHSPAKYAEYFGRDRRVVLSFDAHTKEQMDFAGYERAFGDLCSVKGPIIFGE